MDMKVDSSYIKAQRARRAWSQEHLAEVSGLGLRTIQRIEKTGAASYESARSLAAVFEIDVAELRVAEPAAVEPRRISVSLRPVLGVVGALVTGGALLITTQSFAADQVLMDVSVAIDSSTDEARTLARQVVVEDGMLVPEVNDLKLGDLRSRQGKTEEATAAWHEALARAPQGPAATEAQQRLGTGPAAPNELTINPGS